MAERLKAPVLKTGDVKASVGSNPTLSANSFTIDLRKYPRGRRGSPAKGVGRVKSVAEVQILSSAPEKSISNEMLFSFSILSQLTVKSVDRQKTVEERSILLYRFLLSRF